MLVEGYSSINAEMAIIRQEPLACPWLQQKDWTPTVRLTANPDYWDVARGPRLAEVIFRNDLTPEQTLERICTTEGEVDLVTEIEPGDALRVEKSDHAKLVTIDAFQVIAGVINRESADLPLGDKRARLALNLAIDRSKLVADTFSGWADPLGGLTPSFAVSR